MNASRETIDVKPKLPALEIAEQMERLAAKGDWRRVEQLAFRLEGAVLEVPENERRALVMSIGESLERARTMALASRADVTQKLSGIRRGQVATRAYGQPAGTGPAVGLR